MGEGKDNVATLMGTRRLADAVRAAKIAAAERSDVIIDIREAERARLEILAEELQPVIEEVPAADSDFFDFSISGGAQPRLWIDGTAHVTMARDRRTYRFVRETRLGRVTLAESPDTRVIVDRVTNYIAERIVERDKAFASDGLGDRLNERLKDDQDARSEPIRARLRPKSADFVIAASWFMIGLVIGAGILLAIASWRGFTLS